MKHPGSESGLAGWLVGVTHFYDGLDGIGAWDLTKVRCLVDGLDERGLSNGWSGLGAFWVVRMDGMDTRSVFRCQNCLLLLMEIGPLCYLLCVFFGVVHLSLKGREW